MKALFVSIRKRNFDKVKKLIEKDKSLVNCVSKHPPKKDDGQSPLQICFKTGNFDIADYLIDNGADVNFIESQSVNEWKAPVLHDAIRATVFASRYPGISGLQSTKKKFNRALRSLKKLIQNGADISAVDSYGNNCAMRATLDARQLTIKDENRELIEDLSELFNFLLESGANFNESTNKRQSVISSFGHEPVARFFKKQLS